MGWLLLLVGIFYNLQYRTSDRGFFDGFRSRIIASASARTTRIFGDTLGPAQGKPRFSKGKSDPDVNYVSDFLFRDQNENTLNIPLPH